MRLNENEFASQLANISTLPPFAEYSQSSWKKYRHVRLVNVRVDTARLSLVSATSSIVIETAFLREYYATLLADRDNEQSHKERHKGG